MTSGRWVTVGGLVLVRQRPGTAKGVIFATLEDETGIANVIVWSKVFEVFRPVVLGARLVGVTGRLQNESGVIHVVADRIEDLTPLLRRLSEDAVQADTAIPPGAVERPVVRHRHPRTGDALVTLFKDQHMPGNRRDPGEAPEAAMPKGRNFH